MTDPEHKIVLAISNFPVTLKAAEDLLVLARQQGTAQHPLPACIAVVLGAALAQAIHYRLRYQAHSEAEETDTPVEDTPPWRLSLRSVPLPKKLLDLPRVCSNGAFELRRDDVRVETILTLIRLRNELVHIEEEPLHRRVESEELQQDNAGALQLKVNVPAPPDYWTAVSLADVERFKDAVMSYIQTVVEADPADYQEGALLRRIS